MVVFRSGPALTDGTIRWEARIIDTSTLELTISSQLQIIVTAEGHSFHMHKGPGLVRDIKHGLAQLLQRDGFVTVSEAVGVDTPIG